MNGIMSDASQETKGGLLYKTPREFPKYKIIALFLQLCILIVFIILNIIVLVVLMVFIVAILVGALMGGGGTWLPFFDEERLNRIMTFRIIHHRVWFYEDGITYPISEIMSTLFPEKEGRFIPINEIRAYEWKHHSQQCVIYLKGKPSGWGSKLPHFRMINKYPIVEKWVEYLKGFGIHEVPGHCPKCEGNIGSREACPECDYDRFENIESR